MYLLGVVKGQISEVTEGQCESHLGLKNGIGFPGHTKLRTSKGDGGEDNGGKTE